jgi:hypothetical protein
MIWWNELTGGRQIVGGKIHSSSKRGENTKMRASVKSSLLPSIVPPSPLGSAIYIGGEEVAIFPRPLDKYNIYK